MNFYRECLRKAHELSACSQAYARRGLLLFRLALPCAKALLIYVDMSVPKRLPIMSELTLHKLHVPRALDVRRIFPILSTVHRGERVVTGSLQLLTVQKIPSPEA